MSPVCQEGRSSGGSAPGVTLLASHSAESGTMPDSGDKSASRPTEPLSPREPLSEPDGAPQCQGASRSPMELLSLDSRTSGEESELL